MKILFSWLKEFVDVPERPYEVAEKLTMAGIETSSVQYLGEGLDGIVVGRIEKIEKHPNADRLTLCHVTDGRKKHAIVCGAPNIREGDTVPLALLGAVLPGGFEIKRTKIRGVYSEGMMCSEKELGVSEDHTGIMILPGDIEPGMPVKEALHLDDHLLEIEITPNRGDCISVVGIARELSALYGVPLKLPQVDFQEDGENIHKLASVDIEDLDLCPRYSSRVISDVEIGPSPFWLQQRLKLCGIRPINNVVDITNYILLELGQPMHAFDLDLLEEHRIVVKRAGEEIRFRTLDGIERNVDPDMLLIWDGKQPVAVAGVMGGENTEVRDETTRVLFESAHFSPYSIRKTSRKLGLSTESSYRFERGVDPAWTLFAVERAVSLLLEFSSFNVCRGFIDVKDAREYTKKVPLRTAKASFTSGMEFTDDEVRDILGRLGCTVAGSEGKFDVTIPPHRFDIEREIDLIEELVRVKGYERIPTTYPRACAPHESKDHEHTLWKEKLSNALSTLSFCEVLNYSFMSSKTYEFLRKYSPDFNEEPIRISNPISEETAVMRPSLVHGLIKTVSTNIARYEKDIRIFEVGKIFKRSLESSLYEEIRLGFAVAGSIYPNTYLGEGREVDFAFARSVVENVLQSFSPCAFHITPGKIPSLYAPKESCVINIGEKTVGYLGKVNPEVTRMYDVEKGVYLCEIDLSSLFRDERAEKLFVPISKYPPVERDFSFVLPYEVPVGDIVEYVRRVDETIQRVHVFDLYRSEKVGMDKKSIGMRVVFQSHERTLTEEEVGDIHKTIVKLIENRFGGRIRN